MITVLPIQNQADLEKAFEIRRKVFVEEQQVDAREEYDEYEATAHHYLAFVSNVPVATCRWRKTEKGVKMERFAVLAEYRSQGLGAALVQKCLVEIPVSEKYLYLHAQLTAMGLYHKMGFIAEGEQFSEANILHYKMVLQR